ncbi:MULTISPECIES: sensor histidine kinase [Streptosporangium]|uniref:histidine kinase n=1 Tax=Streptosporangium brasiliense TaxID=47480 RepID=A0ABT9R5G4_9ACTN|nr:ATP-binding protein [Streptosporangium brasiliense]MDP9864482.1 signal transduction histidine kinase [Streptosporangium brasiliense]
MGRWGTLGWRDPECLAASPGRERVHRFVAMLLILQRLSYLVPAGASLFNADGLYEDRALNALLLAVALAWNVLQSVSVRRRGWFAPWVVGADVAVTCVLMMGVTANCVGAATTGTANWSSSALLSTGAVVGAFTTRPRHALALLPPIAAYAVAHAGDLGLRYPLPLDLAVRVNGYVWFAVIVYFIRRYLAAQARRLDDLTELRLAAEAEQARSTERLAHYRQLHDTVLTTLTAIARGGLDHRAEQVRRRCAADAEYVRALIGQDSAGPPTTLSNGLAQAVARAACLGLRVRHAAAALPERLPPEVTAALTDACGEALNNVAVHSGAGEAWLTAVTVDGAVTIRVVDRGRGFAPGETEFGFGLRSSVIDRMREAGGSAAILAAPGEGTCVELVWPAG